MSRPCEHTEIVENCICCATYVKFPRHRHFWDTGERLPPDPTVPIAKPVPKEKIKRMCNKLGERLEELLTCPTGWRCNHVCTSTDPAVIAHLNGIMVARPSHDCQECPGHPDYKPDA